MSTLVIDAETTDLIKRDRPLSDPSQPRLVQIGAVLFDKKRVEVGSMCHLIRPSGWVSGSGAAKTHGITERRCELYGARIVACLASLMDMVRSAEEVVAYGLEFDAAVIDIELALLRQAPTDWKRPSLRRVCAMQEAAQVANDGRWMKLPEAHLAITGEPYEPTHNALSDARATARIWFAVCDLRKEKAA